MTEEQLSDLQTRFVKGEEGTLRNAVTECLNLSAEGKRNPRHPRIPSMLALSRETREKIADCVPKRDLFLDLEQAICRINALQSEVEALRDLEREGPMGEERARGLREAAREPTEVDRHNPFEGALWDEADQISRIKERYESRIEEMREEYQQLQNKITEMEAENIRCQARIAELIQEQRDSADRELSPGEEEQMRKIVDSRVSKIIEEQQGEIDRQHREELARCDAANGGLREQVKSMEATVEAQRKELEELRKKAKGKPTVSFKEGVDESESERLREEVKSAKRKIASLKTELDEKSESLKQAKTEAGKTEEARKSASQTEEELAKTNDMLATVKAELQKTKETKEADQERWVNAKRELTEKLREAEMKVSKAERELKARDKLENELREKIANPSTTTQGGKAAPKQPDTGALNKEIEQLKREKKGLGEKLDAKSEEFDKYKRETEMKAMFADGVKENLEHQIIEARRASKRDARDAEEKKNALEDELSESYKKIESLERQIDEMKKKRDSGPTDEVEKDAGIAPAETARKPEEEKKKPDEPDTAGNSGNQPDKRDSEPMEVDDESARVEKEKETKRDESSKPGAVSAPDKSNQSGEASRTKPGEIFQDDQGTRWRRKDQASGSQSGGHPGPGPSGPSTDDADEEVVVRISVEAAGVLGLNSKGERVTGVGAYTAIVDPAGMNYIREGPRGAGAASGAIYEWLEAKDLKAFPKRIQAGIKRVTDAIFHRYREERNVIHAVGPDFRQIDCDEEGAEAYLARTYANVFREALRAYNQFKETSKLRLLPISSGVFAGRFTREQMARITTGAIEKALKSLGQHRVKLLAELEITMCIYDPDQVKLYREAMASLIIKGYIRRGEAPEPLPDTDGGSKRKREDSQPPQAMEEEEEEEILEMPPHVHPNGDYETEFTRSVSIEERCAKAAEGSYTMMQVEGSSLRDEVNLDIPQSEGTESRPSAQDANKQNNVIEADVYNPHRIEKTNAKEVTRDDMWSECPMVDDLIQAEELQKVMKIKGWDIGLSDNDRKKGHDEIIKSGLQIGPYRTAYEEIHPDAHGVVNVDDEGRRRLKRMMIGQARINRAVLTDGPKFQGGEEDATERASQFDEKITNQLRDTTGEELERMKRALERGSIIPQNYPIENTKTLREHYEDILSPLATELRSSLGMPTINPQVVREQIEKAEREFIIGWTGASRNELGIPQYMAHGHERTHTLEGAQEQDKRKRYPVEVIRRLARNVADVVGHGYEEMKDSAEGRRTQKQAPLTRSVSTFDPYFLKCDSHAVPWSWIRQKVEERCGYTIRDLEEREIAYYAQTYGTEVLGSLGMCKGENKDGEIELRPGVARVIAMRPAGVIGAISVVQGATRSTKEDRLTPPNGHQAKGVWRDIELEELPKVAYYTMSVGEWVKMMSGAVAIAPASGDENVILEWYPEGSRSRGIRGWIPYSPPWMKRDYDTGNPGEHPPPITSQCDELDVLQPLRLDHAKYGRHPHVVQSLRKLANRGRRVTIAVDVALLKAAGGRIYLTRNGRLAVPGQIPTATWHYVFFEDTKTVIYERGLELERKMTSTPRESIDDHEFFEQAKQKGAAKKSHGEALSALSKIGVRTTHCISCAARVLIGQNTCSGCFVPIIPRPDCLEGRGGNTEGRDASEYADWKKTFIEWAEGFGLKVRTSDVRYRQDGIDARVIAGMMSGLHPVEDMFLHFRTGIQTDTLATMRRPMVNRFLLEETWIKAMDIDIKTELEIAKLFNYRIKSVSNELANCKSFHDLYWTEAMTPFLVTRIQFYTSPAGSTVRPAFWFSRHNALAMRVFYKKVEDGKGLSLGVVFTAGNAKRIGDTVVKDVRGCRHVIENLKDDVTVVRRYQQSHVGEESITDISEIRTSGFDKVKEGSTDRNKQGVVKYEPPINVAMQTYFLRRFEGAMTKVLPQNFGRSRHEETMAHVLDKRNAVTGAPAWAFIQSSGTHPAKPRFFRGDAMDETGPDETATEREDRNRSRSTRGKGETREGKHGSEIWGEWTPEGRTRDDRRPAEPGTSPERDGQGEKERAPESKGLTGLRLKDKRKKGRDPAGTDRNTEAREAVLRVERTGGNDGHTTPMGRNTGVGEAATTRRGRRKERTRAKGKRARERETRPEAGIAEATEPGAQQQQTEHERTDRRAHSSGEGEEGSG